MRRLAVIWLACLLLALFSSFYETIKLNLHSLQIGAADYVPTSASAIIDSVYSYTAISADGDTDWRRYDGINYTTFLAMHGDPFNYSDVVTDHPIAEFFPDFCGDCKWGGSTSCETRADFLVSNYKTKDAYDVLLNDTERPTCRNPPMPLYRLEDDHDEGDEESMFAHERPLPGSIALEPLVDISIYFYESLLPDVGRDLEMKMLEEYSNPNSTGDNLKADIAIIDLFRTFPGRTNDSSTAELFVVPYAHASHCLSKPTGVWINACGHIKTSQLQAGVIDQLDHYQGNELRHLFLNVINMGNSNPFIRNRQLTLSIGPRYKENDLLVPYLNDMPSNQPGAILDRPVGWWTRPRIYSVCLFVGITNSRMRHSPRIIRQHFIEEVQSNWNSTIGGLPYAIRVLSGDKKPLSRFFTYLYKESIFCPILAGDTPPQKRFFDVILMGCIPVVVSCPTNPFINNDGNRSTVSWHTDGGRPYEDAYPWTPESGNVYPHHAIDYKSFVVEVPCSIAEVRPTIENLMNNYTDIRRRQLNMMKYAPLLSYGMGADSHRYPDAFYQILQSLRHHVDNLKYVK